LDSPAGAADLLRQLPGAGDARDRRIAGQPPDRFGGNGGSPFQLAGGCASVAGQRVEACPDGQLGSRSHRVTPAPALVAELDERIRAPLAGRPVGAFGRRHQGVERAAQRRPAYGVQQAVEPDQAIQRLADLEVPPGMCAVRLGQGAGRVDPMLEVLGDPGELARIHRPGRFEQHRFFLAYGGTPHVLGGPGDHGDVLIAELATGKSLLGLR